MTALVVAGTDTGVGKTVVAAMLTLALDAVYWKPVQSGTLEGTDAATVATLTGLGPEHFLAERYLLTQPLSPHRAAELDGVEIDPAALMLPEIPAERLLVVEGAGGLMVPLTRRTLFIDVFRRWGTPVVVVARTSLGTINHTLLSIEALRTRNIPIVGIVFAGDANADTEETITAYAGVRRLGRLARLPALNARTLQAAFAAEFRAGDFILQ